jgi:ABC-type amino acid transport substrate-binding protein
MSRIRRVAGAAPAALPDTDDDAAVSVATAARALVELIPEPIASDELSAMLAVSFPALDADQLRRDVAGAIEELLASGVVEAC